MRSFRASLASIGVLAATIAATTTASLAGCSDPTGNGCENTFIYILYGSPFEAENREDLNHLRSNGWGCVQLQGPDSDGTPFGERWQCAKC